jgi:hypothetical protein
MGELLENHGRFHEDQSRDRGNFFYENQSHSPLQGASVHGLMVCIGHGPAES